MSDPNVDMDQVMLDLLVHEGFLEKQEIKGKTWYKRTTKQLPKATDEVDGNA